MLAIVNLHNETFACIPELPEVTERERGALPSTKVKREKKYMLRVHWHDKYDNYNRALGFIKVCCFGFRP